MVILQLNDPLEQFVNKREFLPGSDFLSRRKTLIPFFLYRGGSTGPNPISLLVTKKAKMTDGFGDIYLK